MDELGDENILVNTARIRRRTPKKLLILEFTVTVAVEFLKLSEDESLIRLEKVRRQVPNLSALIRRKPGYRHDCPFQESVSGGGIVQKVNCQVLSARPQIARDLMHVGIYPPELFLVAGFKRWPEGFFARHGSRSGASARRNGSAGTAIMFHPAEPWGE